MTENGRYAWRIWLPPLLVVMIMVCSVAYQDGRASRAPTGAQLILIFHSAAALLVRQRYPLAVAVVTVAAGVVLPVTAHHLVLVDVAAIVALYTLATLRGRRISWITGAAAAVALTAAAIPWQADGLFDIGNLIPANYVGLAVAVGYAIRNQRALLAEIHERAALAERTREQEAHQRVREERIRIARDLHDVLAHHITLVNAQAGVAHHLMAEHPDKAREALAGIRDTSRAVLDELRATVGLLRQDDDAAPSRQPVPGITDLDALFDGFRSAGFAIEVTRSGEPAPLHGVADLAAYRIVQEALTNAGKHGTERHAGVDLHYTPAGLHLTVTNPAHPARRGDGTSHGLIGMRERAQAAGGTLTTAMDTAGTYTVHARLPLHPAQT